MKVGNMTANARFFYPTPGWSEIILLRHRLWELIRAIISHISRILTSQIHRLGMGNGSPVSGIWSFGSGNSHIAGCDRWDQVGVGLAAAYPFRRASGISRATYGLAAILL